VGPAGRIGEGAALEILIQHRESKLYIAAGANWSENASKAQRFSSTSEAVRWIQQRQLGSQAQVVWKSPQNSCDWVLWQPPKTP
jgi:hypothetical protein